MYRFDVSRLTRVSLSECGGNQRDTEAVFHGTHMVNRVLATVLPNGRLPESRNANANDPEALRARITELETLCAEVYLAAVELGLPQVLLNRLWTVAAKGSTPHAFDVEMPPRPVAPPAPVAAAGATEAKASASVNGETVRKSSKPVHHMPLPDIRLTDRPAAGKNLEPRKSTPPELKDLPERRTVLVVDDDPMMLEVLVRILKRENYDLLTAASGPEALSKAGAHKDAVHLLITDYAMPGMKGVELAEQMRNRYSDIRVLYQTGFSDMLFENRVELEEGAAFLEKPFTARGLREAARFILFGAINPVAEPEEKAS